MRDYARKMMTRALAAMMVLAGAGVALAGDVAPKVPIDKAKGECVLPADQMRREHMHILKHRRDETMFHGVRGGKTALEACLTCHVVKGKDGKPVTVASEKHFCRVCHDYAAVRVDCWACHKSVPEQSERQAALPGEKERKTALAQLRAFLQQGGRK